MSVQKFITAIASETEGFVLDEPWRLNPESLSVIVPIKRKTRKQRKYITFAEAQNVKVEDTGQVNYLYVQNNEDKPLLISRGELFAGKAQERVAIHGYVIMPKQGSRINVHCVHYSKPTRSGTEMKYAGRAPYDVDLSNQMRTWDSVSSYSTAFFCQTGRSPINRDSRGGMRLTSSFPLKSNNGTFSVQSTSAGPNLNADTVGGESALEALGVVPLDSNVDMGGIPAADDLVNTLDDMSSFIKEAMKKIPPIKNQVGAIFLYENKIRGIDVYDVPASWNAVKEDIIKKEGSSYLKKEDTNIFEFKPEKVKGLIGKELAGKFEEKVIFGETQKLPFKIIEIREVKDDDKKDGRLLFGEAVEYEGEVIQLTLYR
jgi:hypothetical protein